MSSEALTTCKPPLQVEVASSPPADWRQATLGDIIALEYGRSLPDKMRRAGDVPVYGSNGVVGWHDEALVPSGGIVIGRKGTAGSVTVSSQPFWPIDTTYFVRARQPVDADWLAAILLHCRLNELNEATGVPGLNRDKAYRQPVLLPPLDEQRRIAEVLRSVDEAIAAQRLTVEQHIRLIDANFEEWSLQPAPTVALGDLLDFKNGINFEKDEKGKVGTLTLDVMNMFSADMTPTYEGVYRISKAVPPDLLLQRGDILFVRSSVKQQGIGWTSLADGFGENTTFCGFIIRGRPKKADVLPQYVVGTLRAPKYRRWLIQHSTRSALTNINQKTIASVEIPLPGLYEQQSLVEQYEQLATASRDGSAALARLERLRVHVAHNLLSGHVRVPA